MFSARKSLGLAVTEQGITAVLTGMPGGRLAVLHMSALPFTDEVNLNHPERLGKELRKALRQDHALASRCVIGLASSWIVAREKVLPAADESSLRGALSIAAEREFASGPQDLLFDYSGTASGKGSVSALLVAAPRRVIEQLEAMAKAAGLSVTAITASAAVLAAATQGTVGPAGRLILCLLPRGVELAAQSPTGLRLIRHLPARLDSPDVETGRLWGELRRILTLAPTDHAPGQGRELLVWDSVGLGPDLLRSLGDGLGLPPRLCRMATDLGVTGEPPVPDGERFAQAAALSCRAGTPAEIDFLHSRLAPPSTSRLRRRALWAGIAAAVVLAAGLYFFLDWRAASLQVQKYHDQLAGIKGSLQDANALVTSYTFTRTWYDRRPEFLSCLREITKAFPDEGRIWATSVVIREDMTTTLAGKSTNDMAVLEVLRGLMANPNLADVKLLFSRQVGGNSRDTSFAIGLSLRGAK